MSRLAGACVTVVVAWLPGVQSHACEKLDAPALVARIGSMSLENALNEFASQTRLQWNSGSEEVTGRLRQLRSGSVPAGTSPDGALRRMLQDTGLTYQCVTGRSLKILVAPPPRPPPAAAEPDVELREVVVTGLRNQPISRDTTRISAADLEKSGMHDIDEIARLTPGVEFDQISSVSSSSVYTNFVIRGVTDRHGSTAGLWYDDVPLPSAASNTYARGYPYVFDLDRVEVLRGPQPALLGANAQSGAIQFMPAQPGVDAYSGLVRGEWATTEGGAPTHELGAAFGGPIVDGKVGFRASAWHRSQGGFVDRVDMLDPARPVVAPDSDSAASTSLRIALRLDPGESLQLTPALLYQSTHLHDSSAFNIYEIDNFPGGHLSAPAAGRFYNGSLIAQPFKDHFYLTSLKGILGFGSAELESVTGYFERRGDMLSDDTESLRWGDFGSEYGPAYPARQSDLITTSVLLQQHSFTQQLQLGSTGSGKRSWVLGGFYSNTHSRETDRLRTAGHLPDTFTMVPQLAGMPLDVTVPTTTVQSELAGFGQFRYQLLQRRLVLSAGLRVARLQLQTQSQAPLESQARRNETEVAPQYGFSYDAGNEQQELKREFYFAAGEGYAPGNVDAARPTCNEQPILYPTDTLWSYEAGFRQSWQRRVDLDFNVFQIRWDNGDTAWRTCLFMHQPGKARSQGLGLKARTPLGAGFEARLAAAYVDARYTQTRRTDDGFTVVNDVNPIPSDAGRVLVSAGDAVGTPPQLTAPWTITASIQKDFRLGGDRLLTLFAEDSFHSRNDGPFYTGNPDATYPSQLRADPATNLLDFRAILKLGGCDLSLFISNLLDARPVLLKRNKGNDENTLFYATTFRPRTVGLSVNWSFGQK